MSAPALARLERILLVVPWLLEHPGVDVAEVTRRFGIAEDELAADLDVLGYCGLPGYGGGDLVEVSLAGGRVTLRMADFFARPLALSPREALTLVLVGRAVAAHGLLGDSAALDSAVAKVEAALGVTPAQDPSKAVDLAGPGAEHLAPLREAITPGGPPRPGAAGRCVELTYRSASKGETTTRVVEPWALVREPVGWYLQGWCRLAGGQRDFRLDRILALRALDEPVLRPRPASLRPPTYRPGPGDMEVVLDLHASIRWVTDRVVIDAVEEREDRLRLTFRSASLAWAAALVLQLGGAARVVAPVELADRVQARAQAALALYG